MRVAVVGAGAIGAYVGAALDRGGAEVHLIARGRHLEAMRERGVTVLSARGDFHAKPRATADPNEIGPVDIVFLGLKAYSYADAGPLLKPLLGPGTGVVAAQNGIPWWYFYGLPGPYEGRRVEAVDPDGAVSAVIPPAHAIGCVVYSSTEIESPGVIRHVEGTRFSIGEPDGTISDRCTAFSQAMIAGGLKCPVEKNLRSDIWLKLLGNVAFNPISVLTRATMGEIAAHPGTRELVLAMMRETAEIAASLGIPPKISIERRFEGAAKVGDHKTSMLMDYEAGKPLESDVLLKAPVELARLAGVPAPNLEMVAALIDLLTRGSTRCAGTPSRSARRGTTRPPANRPELSRMGPWRLPEPMSSESPGRHTGRQAEATGAIAGMRYRRQGGTMSLPRIGTREEWLAARKELLAKEKNLTRQRDALSTERRNLPMVEIVKDYQFDGPDGRVRLIDLFEGRPQLMIYHFMFHPEWEDGCPSCTAGTDELSRGFLDHLHVRDTTYAMVSRAPLAKLERWKARKGWDLPWYSSAGSDFNYDFGVTIDASRGFDVYNYRTLDEYAAAGQESMKTAGQPYDMPGLSCFLRVDGRVFHTYSQYARGLESTGGSYYFLDLTALGRQEEWEEPKGRTESARSATPDFAS